MTITKDTCPKCKSANIKPVAGSYPRSYECENCGYMFLEMGKSLVDE